VATVITITVETLPGALRIRGSWADFRRAYSKNQSFYQEKMKKKLAAFPQTYKMMTNKRSQSPKTRMIERFLAPQPTS